MRSLVLQLCSPSLTVRKLAQTAGDATYQPRAGPGHHGHAHGSGRDRLPWILPNTAPAASRPAHGRQRLRAVPVGADTPGGELDRHRGRGDRPQPHTGQTGTDNDYRCELRDEFGNVRMVEDDFADPANPPSCWTRSGRRSSPAPSTTPSTTNPTSSWTRSTSHRGPRRPGPARQVTSTYTVTNPGNTPLSDVAVTDDRCGPVEPVRRRVQRRRRPRRRAARPRRDLGVHAARNRSACLGPRTPGGLNFVNTAVVSGPTRPATRSPTPPPTTSTSSPRRSP